MIGKGRSIALIVFAGGLLFFNWPLVSIADGGLGIIIYLFFLWAMTIFGLYFNNRRQRNGDEGDDQ